MPKVKKKIKKIKKEIKKKEVKKEIKKPKVVEKPEKYYQAVGRRKTAIALVRLFTRRLQPVESQPLESDFLVNEKPLNVYFPNPESQQIALASLKKMKAEDRFRVTSRVKGGGLLAQAEAIRHATARALVLFNPDYRKRLKRAGYLTRDPRMKERKKFGLKRARRAPQWQKR